MHQGDDHCERRIEQFHRTPAERLNGLIDQAIGTEQQAPAESPYHH